jgi:hypothetical protein
LLTYPIPTPIYHITDFGNLKGMVIDGELRSNNEMQRRGQRAVSIAHGHIQDRRGKTAVAVGPGGNLNDYVPFYFAPRSPMLYSIHKGYVQGYAGGQRGVVHLVSDVQAVQGRGLPFVFTDGHGTMALTSTFTDPTDLAKIDWSVMSLRMWNDTDANPDRCRRRQAEFLIYKACPWPLVSAIGVMDAAAKAATEGLLRQLGQTNAPPVYVKPPWYY